MYKEISDKYPRIVDPKYVAKLQQRVKRLELREEAVNKLTEKPSLMRDFTFGLRDRASIVNT